MYVGGIASDTTSAVKRALARHDCRSTVMDANPRYFIMTRSDQEYLVFGDYSRGFIAKTGDALCACWATCNHRCGEHWEIGILEEQRYSSHLRNRQQP